MGLNIIGKTCSLTPPNSILILPNPNPARFTILRTAQIGTSVVAEVFYPDCTNYEGKKILVYRNINEADFRMRRTLDPHFNKYDGPVARFEPTDFGWEQAVQLARRI